ncbi:thiolase family protein [Anaerovorax odorimutans]|uniref:acetyl-CoA C-acyltransferase n=1 Tax=Anaerovorax odorimutans TaxID=109327 RepID=A0ABT1RSW7_9FIRM|nr:thiolase family protein [Anaerovorax odorimutans]MCQ4638301.1 thiolase family protein [Anaerovorax odorimutans]
MTREVVIVDGVRTAFGRMGGALRPYTPAQLAGMTIKGLCEKTGILEKGAIDAVFAGSASGDVNTHNLARYATLLAGLPYETSSTFIEMQCGSSIACINNAALQIQAGLIDTAVCGGAESHSQTYYKYSTAVEPYKAIAPAAAPLRLAPDDADDISMIAISDLMAEKWGVDRQSCDEFALRSQERAAAAVEKGYFKEEILPIPVKYGRKGPEVTVDKDEHLRPQTTMQGLEQLKPVFADGVTTAGNSSGRNDGAAFVLMMSREKAEELGYKPMAKWVVGLDVGVDPKIMGIGPAYSNCKILNKMGLKMNDIDIYECNEAFAAQNLSVIKEMENMTGETMNMENWNPNGGAIAFGHPNGASGARVCIFAMKELVRRGGRYGMFSSCCGGGLGVSTLIENLQGR